MRNLVVLAMCLIVAFGSLAFPARGLAQPIDVDSIREHLRQQWESIESIEWTLDEYLERLDGVAPPTPRRLHAAMSRSKGGLSLFKAEDPVEGHAAVLEHILEDGKNRYTYFYIHNNRNVISELDIRALETIDEGLSISVGNSVSWLTMPREKPLHLHMTSEARAREIEEDGRKLIEVEFPSKGNTLRFLLDPERDWSAVSLEFLDADRTKWKVTKFQRDNDRWFASEGVHTGEIMGVFQEWKFTVTNLKINRPIAPETFQKARLPSGARVVDQVKHTQRIWNGTNKTRSEFLSRYSPKQEPPAAPTVVPPPIRASRDPDGDPWFYAPGALACTLLALAGLLRLRRTRT